MRLVPVLASLLAVAPAHAMPGDDPIVPLSPDDGASVAPSANGTAFVYTCPVYRSSDAGDGFAVYGDESNYSAALATSPELGTDGRLRDDRRVDFDSAHESNTLPEGQCFSTLGNESRAGLEPGTYYWQVSRICAGCDGSYESTAVRRIVVAADVSATVRPVGKVFGGYPAAYRVTASGAPQGTAARLERKAGGRWRSLGTATLNDGAGEAIAILPTGTQTVRVTIALGAQRFTSAPVRVKARPDTGARATSARSDGRWKGTKDQPVSFRVTGAGRVVERFEARVTMLCPQVPPPGSVGGQFTTMAGFARFATARIAPDGRFFGVAEQDDLAVLVRGRLRGRSLSGGVADLSVGTCTGQLRFAARRS